MGVFRLGALYGVVCHRNHDQGHHSHPEDSTPVAITDPQSCISCFTPDWTPELKTNQGKNASVVKVLILISAGQETRVEH